jgi:DNA-binding NarL/FixJ family response regulator
MKKEKIINVGLVEDNKADLKFYMTLLRELPGIVIHDMKAVCSGEEAIDRFDKDLDVVLMDYHLGKGMNGIQAMQEIKKKYPHVQVVILTGGDYEVTEIVTALEAGATAYLRKRDDKFRLEQTIRDAAEGRWTTYTSVITELIEHLKEIYSQRSRPIPPTGERLSIQERSVLIAIAEAKSNDEIATALGMSTDKLKRDILPSIYHKLGLKTEDGEGNSTRLKAVVRGFQVGILKTTDICL